MKRKRLKLSWSVIIFLFLLLSACGNRPSWVLSEKKMTDVLYDVHMAESEIEMNNRIYQINSEKGLENRQELLASIFRKHKITEQRFDTSLVWYNSHLERYFKIYDELNKRYTLLSDTLQALTEKENQRLAKPERTNIWTGAKDYLMLPTKQSQNSFTFRIDSIDWSSGDSFELTFNTLGINKTIRPEVMFYAMCADTTIISKGHIETNGLFVQAISPRSKKVRAVSGFVHIPGIQSNACLVISDFSIYHLRQTTPKQIFQPQKPER